ncbi:MAG: hypothetical protein ICV63_03155 [Coleofasciculus sp. Co-bin14]|nr:hypothetical protein [Coleofasciculus sp. Co-bin14]
MRAIRRSEATDQRPPPGDLLAAALHYRHRQPRILLNRQPLTSLVYVYQQRTRNWKANY